MQLGVKFLAFPTEEQAATLASWIGCRRCIWNAKCAEEQYFRSYARKFCSITTHAPIDKTYSQFKSRELTPWLFDVPAEILKAAACTWAETYQRYIQGDCGRPRPKKKGAKSSVTLEGRLFEITPEGELWLGTKKRPLGKLAFKAHRTWEAPKSLTITKDCDRWFVSFGYDDGTKDEILTQKESQTYLQARTEDELASMVVGLDRGIAIPVHTGSKIYGFTKEQKKRLSLEEIRCRRYRRRMARQEKGSKRRSKTKLKLARSFCKSANIRNDFAHQTSHDLVAKSDKSVFIFEDLKTKELTKRPAAIPSPSGRGFLRNGARAKAALSRAILNIGWHKIERYVMYKALRAGKTWFRIPAFCTSQTCAACGHTAPENRKTQRVFFCVSCGNYDNADANAAKAIAKQAIRLLKDPGTGLDRRGVLRDVDATGRGASVSRRGRKASAPGAEASKNDGIRPEQAGPLNLAFSSQMPSFSELGCSRTGGATREEVQFSLRFSPLVASK